MVSGSPSSMESFGVSAALSALTANPEKALRFRSCSHVPQATRGATIIRFPASTRTLRLNLAQATVLIVEDEAALRQAVAKMLRKSDFEVFEAADGSSAIDLLRANGGNIDLILLDMTIPGAPSSEVVAEAGRVRPDIKVVLTSAYSQEMIASSMTAPQIHSFIRKPFQFEDLLKTLRNSLSS